MRYFLITLAVAIVKLSHANASLSDTILDKLKPLFDRFSEEWNIGISVGIRAPGVDIEYVTGRNNVQDPTSLMKETTLTPVGSFTKLWTSVSILRLVQQHHIKLDDPVHKYVDPIFARYTNHSSLKDCLDNQTAANDITIKHLLHMTSGLHDYNDIYYAQNTYFGKEPEVEDALSPFNILEEMNKTLLHAPGNTSSGTYSSNGYLLLGLVLASHYTNGDWESMVHKQLEAALPHELHSTFKKNVVFFGKGKCSSYKNVAHTFGTLFDLSLYKLRYVDLYEKSCNDGFGFGNIALTGKAVADLFHHLFVERSILDSKHLSLMTSNFLPINLGDPKLTYALGLIKSWTPQGPLFEHGGEDYGSGVSNALT
mmetsp:Transcript_30340/g.48313  ORF Transcript_30340/g.48313 Transcript_30340/m.48313 type:complete len:368 (+) Transcript_30340:40-1143(+)